MSTYTRLVKADDINTDPEFQGAKPPEPVSQVNPQAQKYYQGILDTLKIMQTAVNEAVNFTTSMGVEEVANVINNTIGLVEGEESNDPHCLKQLVRKLTVLTNQAANAGLDDGYIG